MSVPGSNKPPYRAPCPGTVVCAAGSRYQHGNFDPTVDVWLFDALVPDWCLTNNFIEPYQRIPITDTCTASTNAQCSYAFANVCPDQAVTVGACQADAPCIPWIGTPPENADSGGHSVAPCQCPCQWQPGMQYFTDSNPLLPPVGWYKPQMLTGVTVTSGGANYQIGDVLTIAGGTASSFTLPSQLSGNTGGAATVIVTSINPGGVIPPGGLTIHNAGSYDVSTIPNQGTGFNSANHHTLPTSPNTPTGGHGTGAQIALTFGDQQMSFKDCFKYGFKNVQAMRNWHGTPGYFFNEGELEVYQCPTDTQGDICATSIYTKYNYGGSQTKYLTVSYTIDFTSNACTDSFSAEISVDPHSGVCTVNSLNAGCMEATPSFLVPLFGGPPSFDTSAGSIMNSTAEQLLSLALNTWGAPNYANTVGMGGSISCSSTAIDFTGWDGYDNGTYSTSWTIGVGSLSFLVTANFSASSTTSQFQLTLSDSSLYFTWEFGVGGPTPESGSISVTLSNPWTAQNVISDIETLMGEWDMTRDDIYPWRQDGNVSVAPLVTRNEVPVNVSPIGFAPNVATATSVSCAASPLCGNYFQQNTAVDPHAAFYDGSIMGAPMPAGYQGYFDFNYTNFQPCPPSPGQYVAGYGQSVYGAPGGIPLNATQWTGNDAALRFGSGAWIYYLMNPSWLNCTGLVTGFNIPPVGGVWGQKWAETKMAFPSQNFFRPAGDDRFVFDEDFVFGITSIVGSGPGAVVHLENTTNCAGSAPATAAGIWGGPAVGGFYHLSAVSSSTVTLGALAYNVPSNWESASYTNASFARDNPYCFGKLRWQSQSTPMDPFPILGRAGISAVAPYMSNPLVAELTTDLLPNLGMIATGNDAVDIFDQNMNGLASGAAVTRVDDTHFTVPVSVATIANASYIMSHGAPAYQWDDGFSKGDYVYTDWTWDPRLICEADAYNTEITNCAATSATALSTYGYNCTGCPTSTQTVYAYPFSAFTQTAACLPFIPQCPGVICISPNGEAFPNGHTWPFPVGIPLDEQYGSGWQAEIQQIMPDLLYQTPHFPAVASCSIGAFTWSMDDGTCEAATSESLIYSHAPMVEARLTVPAGAPALPTTPSTCGVNQVVIGWTSPVGIIQGNCTPQNTLFPNGFGSVFPPGQSEPVWVLWQNECGCIKDSGEFASIYTNEVIGCH